MKPNTTKMSRCVSRTACVTRLMLLAHITAFACKFDPEAPLPTPEAVFSGTVTEITPVQIPVEGGYYLMNRVTFHVIETWRGTNTATKVVMTGTGGGDCGYPFVLGADYFVFAIGTATNLNTGIFLPTDLLSKVTYGQGQVSDQPLLKTAHDQGATTLSWRTNWTNFRLETTESLEPSSWRTLSNDVFTVGPYYVVTNDVTASRAFFRLAR